jgi:hypothetical protein
MIFYPNESSRMNKTHDHYIPGASEKRVWDNYRAKRSVDCRGIKGQHRPHNVYHPPIWGMIHCIFVYLYI